MNKKARTQQCLFLLWKSSVVQPPGSAVKACNYQTRKEKQKVTLYKIYEAIQQLTIGGWLAVFVILSMFVEIVPFIKINPVAWLGQLLNAPMYKRIDVLEKKLDQHIAQSYRNTILMFQDSLLLDGSSTFTKEQYDEVIDSITYYENYCKDNKIDNDKCTLAVEYIKKCYKECQDNRSFSKLPM